jgi:hypothetical protein
MRTLYHIVLWSDDKVVDSINVVADTKLKALESARIQFPNYRPEITMSKPYPKEKK